MQTKNIQRGRMTRLFFLLFLFLFPSYLRVAAQLPDTSVHREGGDTLIIVAEDTLITEESHDPKKAAIYAAVLPGLGQIYNGKYWKVPIVYLGFGTLGYFIVRNIRYYKDLRQGLIDFPDHDLKYFNDNLTYDQMERGKDIFKRYRDLSYISTAGFYILQILDATVDAHLYDWDVGEDISLRIEPAPLNIAFAPANSFGIRACISF